MIKVRYIKLAKPDLTKKLTKPDSFLRLDSKIVKRSANKRVPPPYIERKNVFKGAKALANKSPELAKPTFSTPDIIAIKKKITLPEIEMARINNPSYISYYQIVREKIRRSAYQNYTHNETGEVYISFVISNDGYIKDVHLIEAKTSASDYLKGIASRSVKDASPFPNFPKELDYPRLSFNIIISFEIE
ncbi:MAG: TonB C-terminal domain-containing protein [Candidatus Omnitrophica bacterium]|nr:TonB C-terminal domain-containing protein [Candidatus Omnitrophota bacterium]